MTKIKGAYTRFVRYVKNIKVFNHTTRISNNDLLKDFDRIEDIIVERILTFAGHCARSNQPVAKILLAEPYHKDNRYLSYPKMLRQMTGLTNAELQKAMMDRDAWRHVVAGAVQLQMSNRKSVINTCSFIRDIGERGKRRFMGEKVTQKIKQSRKRVEKN